MIPPLFNITSFENLIFFRERVGFIKLLRFEQLMEITMRRLWVCGLMMFILTAFSVNAQNIELNVQINDASETATMSTTSSVSGNGYSLNYKMHAKGKSYIKVLSPEGATARIFLRQKVVVTDKIPFSFKAQGDSFYTVEITAHGQKWSRKIEVKDGMIAILRVSALNSTTVTTTVEHHQSQQKQHHQQSSQAMSNARFKSLLAAIKNESFDKDQLNILRDAMQQGWVTSNQVGQIIDIFSFAGSKVQAGTICYPRVVDKGNFYTVYSHLTFSSSKDELRKNIKNLK